MVSEELLKKIDDYGVNAKIDSNVSDAEIIQAYRECDVVCFPSLYEGFGLPIIEGQAIGRPVVTSDLLPMSSIAGKGAVLVNPYSVDSITKGIVYALENSETLIKEGINNADRFSLKHIVGQYMSLYEGLKYNG
jgi:glycosyltransferase involved in cell wall biosynthesis